MIVADASVIIEVILRTAGSERVAARLLDERETLHAPHLLDIEVAQVLRRYVARQDLPEDRARKALSLLGAFPLTRYSHEPLLERIWELRANITAYDAAYVALAEALGAVLLTRDAKLASAPAAARVAELIV